MSAYSIDPTRDIVWQDDGNGRRIVQWNIRLGEPPDEAKSARLVNYPLANITVKEAIQKGFEYVNSFFTQEQQLLMLAMASTGTEDQYQKLKQIYNWIKSLYAEANLNPEAFNPTQPPPYRWEDLQ